MNYSAEVWGFCKADKIETVHLQFYKRLLGVKQSSQNDFIYGELGRTSFQLKKKIFDDYKILAKECFVSRKQTYKNYLQYESE